MNPVFGIKDIAESPQNIPEIQRHMNRLGESISAIESALDVLDQRILGICKPSEGTNGRLCAPTVAATTQLGTKLSATSERLYEIAERIKGITERVEV